MKERNCKFCDELFIPRSNRQIYCDREHYRICPSCGTRYLEKFPENLSKPPRLCSPSCKLKHKKVIVPGFTSIEYIQNNILVDSTNKRNKYDNLNISKYFFSKGVNCIHVFTEDDIEKLIKKIDVNNYEDSSEFQVYKLTSDYTQEFLEENEICSMKNKISLSIGLVRNSEIYQILAFSSPRYSKKYDYEITYSCTRLGHHIHGGLDLLSSEASLKFGISSCIAYQDLSKYYSTFELENIGMKLHHVNVPRLRSSQIYDCGTAVLVFWNKTRLSVKF